MKFRVAGFLALALYAPSLVQADRTPVFQHATWDRFLKTHVRQGSLLYVELVNRTDLLDPYLDGVSGLSSESFQSASREERIALYINIYHALTIQTILAHYPIQDLRDIPPHGERKVRLLGLWMTRQDVEYVLRTQFRDERVLVALYRGTKGGPRLRAGAYTGENLDRWLEEDSRNFVNDRDRNRIEVGKRKIWISSLFRWYAQDFVLNYTGVLPTGKSNAHETAVLSFLAHYIDEGRKGYVEMGRFRVNYRPYDWSLDEADAFHGEN